MAMGCQKAPFKGACGPNECRGLMSTWKNRLFLVEDEALVLMDLEETVSRFGYSVVGTASSLSHGLQLAAELDCDAALLDLDLSGVMSTPIADLLARRFIPFIIVTGYDEASIPRAHSDRPQLSKPYNATSLKALLDALEQSALASVSRAEPFDAGAEGGEIVSKNVPSKVGPV
jgi:CheY-like chemotaxis protein